MSNANEYVTETGTSASMMMANMAASLMNDAKINLPDHSKMARAKAKSVTAPKPKAPKPVVAKVAKVSTNKPSKIIHPDGTVFFRTDRNKWIAMADGKQEAARDTAEKCIAFLAKKYPTLTPVVIPKE